MESKETPATPVTPGTVQTPPKTAEPEANAAATPPKTAQMPASPAPPIVKRAGSSKEPPPPQPPRRDAKPAGPHADKKPEPPRPTPPDPEAFHAAFTQAYADLRTKLDAAWNPLDLGQAAAEAETELQHRLTVLTAPHQELERCEARVAYLRAVRQLSSPERQRAQIAFAFTRYLDTIRPLWARDDLGELDPGLLSQFGESIAWAGYYASQRPDA